MSQEELDIVKKSISNVSKDENKEVMKLTEEIQKEQDIVNMYDE